MLADAALNKEHAEKYVCGLAPASVLVFSDPNHETLMLVISDTDDCFPERVYTWGPHSGRCAEEVEAVLAAYRERNPVPDK